METESLRLLEELSENGRIQSYMSPGHDSIIMTSERIQPLHVVSCPQNMIPFVKLVNHPRHSISSHPSADS